jgi:hypothetical protein
MDSTTSGTLGILAVLVSVFGVLYTAINHKHIRMHCCGRTLEMSVDVDPTDSAKVAPAPPAPVPEEDEEEE